MISRFARAALALFAAVVVGSIAPPVAIAQPGQAPGQAMRGGSTGPTPAPASLDANLEAGSVVVTVIAGREDKPLADINVVLQSDSRKVARTDASGKAAFSGLSSGEYVVSAMAGGALVSSEPFALPESGGVTIVLSSVAIDDGRGGRPSSRMMSGRARPEQNDPSGQLTVRAIAGELKQSQFGGLTADIPTGAIIHLVEMHADGKMTVRSEEVKEENEGRVVFGKLARDNSIAYYAMTTYERAGGTDRLMTEPLDLPPQIGSRMMFAGAPTNSANPGIDDLGRLSGTGNSMPGPGVVEVLIYAEASQAAYINSTSEVELIQIGKDGESMRSPALQAQPSSASVMGQAGPMRILPDTEPGHVSFYAARPSTKSDLAGVNIRIELADPAAASAEANILLTTSAKGLAYAKELIVGTQYVAVATLHGVETRSEVFTPLADKPLSFAFAYEWKDQDGRQARFEEVAHGASNIYIAKVFSNGRSFFSLPFQLTKERGASVGIYMYPELLFSLRGAGQLDDQKLWFNQRFTIANPGVMPFRPDARGLIIPLPKGFIAASVADEMTSRVGVESGKGFLWRGAVPPGQRDFIASYALNVSDGAVSFDMDLPYGLRGGRVVVEDHKEMELRTPPGAKVEPLVQPNGSKYLAMPDINIEPKQRLVFGLTGLPQESKWQGVFRYIVGAVALLLMFWAIFAIFFGPKGADKHDPVLTKLEANREQLMNQLVKLETEHRHKRGGENSDAERAYKQRRDKLNTKLTSIYRDIDEHKAQTRVQN